MSAKEQPKRLGRGLAALMGEVSPPAIPIKLSPVYQGETIMRIPVTHMGPSRFQARRQIDEGALRELADSIAAQGVLQPLLVRQVPGVEFGYEIVAGERRWRAAQLAKLHDVPALIRNFSDQEVMAIGLIENLQREDLNPVDEAEGYQRLMTEFKLSQEKMAEAVGKSRAHVSNVLRLLTLPPAVLQMTREGAISTGHAKALVNHEHPLMAARAIVAKNLTVRQIEQEVARQGKPQPAAKAPNLAAADADALGVSLTEKLGVRVKLAFDGSGGSIVINYRNLDQLDELLKLLNA